MKRRSLRRFLALLLTLTMLLSCAPAAWAEDTAQGSDTTADGAVTDEAEGEGTADEEKDEEKDEETDEEPSGDGGQEEDGEDGGDGEDGTPDDTESVLLLSTTSLIELEVGGTRKLSATISGEEIPAATTLTWRSNDEKVFTVDQTGKITAAGPGRSSVWAETSDGLKSAATTVVVSGVALSYGEKTLEPGETITVTEGRSLTLAGAPYGKAEGQLETWTSSNMSVGSVRSGKVSTYNPGKTTITYQSGSYKVTCEIAVEEDVVNAIEREMTVGESLSLGGSILSELQALAAEKTQDGSGTLDYITSIFLSTDAGTLYYGYISPEAPGSGVGGSEKYYADPTGAQKGIEDILFIPAPDFSGTAIISYTGFSGLQAFSGTIRIEVTNAGDVAYTTAAEQLLKFRAEDFSTVSFSKTGSSLQYLTFTLPAATRGTLYYNYTAAGQYAQKVTAGTRYHVSGSSSRLEDVSFLPATGFTGAVTIPYSAVTSAGTSYQGVVTITVTATGGGQDGSGIIYDWANTVSFFASDFNTVSLDMTGRKLDYVCFDLPQAAAGTLYCAAAPVSAAGRYYYSGSPSLGDVAFVPAGEATVVITYTGYAVSGERFTGQVSIIPVSAGEADVTYTTAAGAAVSFDGADFNEACYAATGDALSRLSFTLPGADKGTLYQYSTSSSGRKVTSSNSFTVANLSKVKFDPDSGYTGTVSIPFSGQTVSGATFRGAVKIVVTESYLGTVNYQGSALPVAFRAADIREACAASLPRTLAYITLDYLPAASSGKVMVNASTTSPATEAKAGEKYYNVGIPAIDTLSFVARAGYTGVVNVSYTAVDIDGNSVSGSIRIQISDSNLPSYFTDMTGLDWAAAGVAYLRYTGVTDGYGDGRFGPQDNVTRAQFVTMLVRLFRFETRYTANFSDVPSGAYYRSAVMTAKALGIVQGDGGRFDPDGLLTREQAVVMLQRAMEAAGKTVTAASESLLSGFGDGGEVSAYAKSAMASMVRMGLVTGSYGRLEPASPITRAEMAVLLHRVATL